MALEATGPRIGQGPRDLVLSGDGSLIALPSGGGNYVPAADHPPQKYGTYLYKPSDLNRPVSVIESGPHPQAIGFDAKHDLVYAQNGQFELITFRVGGTKLKSYHLRKGRMSVGTPVRFEPQPDGTSLLLGGDAGVFLLTPALGPPADDEPEVKKPKAPRSRMNPKAKSKPKPKAKPDP